MFTKPPSGLTKEDIETVIHEAWQEDGQVEFKAALPSNKRSDPWVEGTNKIGDKARNEIIEEVIAFANAYGGVLILGIAETKDKPSRAERIAPLPRCQELAERLRLQVRDCVDPPIPFVEAAGITTEDDGSGVVVIQVPRSRLAPHRHNVTRECYFRRSDRSEKMTMREIQDLTLQTERGMALLDKQLQERRQEFERAFQHGRPQTGHRLGMRASVIPVVPLHIDNVHANPQVQPRVIRARATLGKHPEFDLLWLHKHFVDWRPILRGSRSHFKDDRFDLTAEVHCTGLIELSLLVSAPNEDSIRERPLRLRAGSAMAMAVYGICAVELFRRAAGAPEVEFAMEMEIRHLGYTLPVDGYDTTPWDNSYGPFPEYPVIFPKYSVGPMPEFQKLMTLIETDFWSAAGEVREESIKVDFDDALQKFGLTSHKQK